MADDYIRRQDAIDVAREDGKKIPTVVIRIMHDIKTIPPIDVAPVVHAYWRDTGSGQECSYCKEIQYGYDTGRHYCANCGAKMDGGEEHG